MKKYLVIPALLAISAYSSGQSNFIKAFIIDNKGDTIHGNIDYRNWKNNPQTINFINSTNEKLVFDPSSIRGFYIPSVNETYASFLVDMDMITSDQFKAFDNNFVDSATRKKRVFLLQLIRHPALNLYEFTGNHKDHFYYEKVNEEPVELIHHYLYNESASNVQEVIKYREQLAGLFANCTDVANASKTIKFRKKEIQNIFLNYLQCADPGSAADVKKKDPVPLKFGILAGVMFNTFKLSGEHELADDNYSGNVSPVFGVSLDAGLSRDRNKWHIVNELIYKSYKTSSAFTRPYVNGYTSASDIDLSFSYAQINTILRYIFPSNASLKPFINVGMGNAFVISENANTAHIVYSFGTDTTAKAMDPVRKYEFSLMAGVGVTFAKIQAELRYGANKKGFSPAYNLDTNPRSFQFLFTYQF